MASASPFLIDPFVRMIPCPEPSCDGFLNDRHDLAAYECSKCCMLVTRERLISASGYSNTYWKNLSAQGLGGHAHFGLTRAILEQACPGILLGKELMDRKRAEAKYIEEHEQRFLEALDTLVEVRGYSYPHPMRPPPAITSPPPGFAHTGSVAHVSGVYETKPEFFEAQAVPTSDEPVRAWRAWKVMGRRKGTHADEPILRSITYGTQWLPRVAFRASCIYAWQKTGHRHWNDKGPHTSPGRDCTCGVYAKTTPRGASGWAAQFRSPMAAAMYGLTANTSSVPIVGLVSLWGRVLLYTEGYRGESAYPYHLFIPQHLTAHQAERWGSAEELAKQLRSSYACDVEVVPYQPPDPPPGLERNPYGKDPA